MQMFQSATVKLTAWYLAILMAISFIFSVAIYQVTFRELNVRLQNLQQGLMELDLDFISGLTLNSDQVRLAQSQQASEQMLLTLFYVNLFILIGGGIGSYLLARRTLRPIERAHEAQSRFTSDASHELRTPLSAMKAEIEVALRDPNLSQAEAREQLESNLEEVNKLISLSEVLLKLAHLDYDKLPKSPVNLGDVLESTLRHFPRARKRFDITARKKAIAIGNEASIQEVMTILLDNAIKYSKKGSKITVKVFERRLMAVFQVTNTGSSIPPDQQQRIFERFYRSDTARTAQGEQKSYGLGLAIAKKIVGLHHGTIEVVSKNDMTTFTVALPNRRNVQARV